MSSVLDIILNMVCNWWAHLASNQGPTGYEPVALPTELWARCHFSMNVLSRLLRLGCLNFLKALASI